MDLKVLYQLTYGLYIVGAFKGGRPVGCVINTCFQVTSENPLLVISVNKDNYTLEAIRENRRFSLSIVAEETQPEIIGKFGFFTGRDTDKYADFGFEVHSHVPCVNGIFAGRLILEAEQCTDCGTHVLVLARLIDTIEGSGTPMTYAYYHRVIKGKAPKNAPTYQAESKPADSGNIRRYECQVCHYIAEVEGELPEDYTCPVCGVDRSFFKEIV